MIVVSFHGRAGQGVKTAVEVFSKAVMAAGMQVQALFFPAPERRSAPVSGIVKLDKARILSKQVERADFCIIMDPTLDIKGISNAVKDGGSMFILTSQKPNTTPLKKRKIKAFMVDLSLSTTKPAANMAMLGALVKNFNKISMKSIKGAAGEMDAASVEEGYKFVKMVK